SPFLHKTGRKRGKPRPLSPAGQGTASRGGKFSTFYTEFSTFNFSFPQGRWKRKRPDPFPQTVHKSFTSGWKSKTLVRKRKIRVFHTIPGPYYVYCNKYQ